MVGADTFGMSTFASHLHLPARLHSRMSRVERSLSLQRTAAGWALVSDSGRVEFEAAGRDGRRQCLAFASQRAISHVRFDEQLRAA